MILGLHRLVEKMDSGVQNYIYNYFSVVTCGVLFHILHLDFPNNLNCN